MITLEMQRVENMGQHNTNVVSRCSVRELETENVATLYNHGLMNMELKRSTGPGLRTS